MSDRWTINKKQVQAALYKMGFDNAYTSYKQAVKGFQFGWNLGARLKVDGIAGAKTQKAILVSLSRHARGKGNMSWNFSFAEFKCKCGGKFKACKRNWTSRAQVHRLEKYRKRLGRSVRIISGYRCVGHNAAVGGATKSQHLYGYSSDFQGAVKADTLASWGIFAGVGRSGRTGLAVHGDSRDASPYNFTRGSTSRPTRWNYSW